MPERLNNVPVYRPLRHKRYSCTLSSLRRQMEMSGQQHAPATVPTEQGGTRWCSWLRLRSRIRSPVVSLT